jgi:hypothetical protein
MGEPDAAGMETRIAVQLEREELEAPKTLARRRHVSVSRVARRAIRKELGLEPAGEDRDAAVRRFLAAAGCGREPDAATDVGRRHDRFLS